MNFRSVVEPDVLPGIALNCGLRKKSSPTVSENGPFPATCVPDEAAAALAKKDVPASLARSAASHARMSPNPART